ncbi:MAG TPA: hypothetical protein VGO38_08370 [Acidimicrobiia bacterium]|jgi:hypothetical protein
MTAVEDVTADVESPSTSPPTARLAFRLFVASIVVAVVPVAVATARAIHNGWLPTGDNALFAVRARDLFTHHLPLLGSWSSASVNAGTQLNHPGPLYFDLLAVPARVVQSGAGVAFGAALVNALCIVGIAVFAYRGGGALLGTIAMAATASLCWAMGSELMFEPWNPHSALLPFLLFLVLVWSMTCGDLLALPLAAGVGSLLVQTHLSYALLVPLLAAWGIVGLFIGLRRQRGREPDVWAARRARALRVGAVAAVVFAVCWIQPLIEQFTSDGSGNLTRLVESGRSTKAGTIGVGFGTRVVATVVSLPPWWFRPSLKDAFAPGWHEPSLGSTVLSLVVLFAVLGGCIWVSLRRRDRVSTWAIATAVVGLLAAFVTAWQGPVTVFGNVTPHTFRWLWPLGAFVFFAIASTIARRLAGSTVASTRSAWLVAGFALVTVAVAALNLPFADEGRGPNSQEYAIPAAHDLGRQMGSLEGRGAVLIDGLFRAGFADPYGAAVVAELQRRGIPFVARDPVLVRQYGPTRRFNGHNAKAALLLRTGAAPGEAPAGSRRVARGEGLSARDQHELSRVEAQIGTYVEEGQLRLNPRGQAALDAGNLPNLAQVQGGSVDPHVLFDSRELDVMIQQRFLTLDPPWTARFERYAALQRDHDRKTVALFVESLPRRGP